MSIEGFDESYGGTLGAGYANDSWGPGNIWNRGCQVVGHDEVDGHLSGQQAMASENGHRPDSNC